MSTYNKQWNRSSAWSREVLARLTTAAHQAIEASLLNFNKAWGDTPITDEERAEAVRLICVGVTKGIAEFEHALRARWQEVEAACNQ